MSNLIAIQETQQRLIGNQANQAPVSTPAPPVVKPLLDETAQDITPANVDNLWTARRAASLSEEPSVLLTKAEKAVFGQERERASTASAPLDLKPPYPDKAAAKQFPLEYKVPKYQKFDSRKANTREHVARFIDS